jgi:hypothetical protein
MLAAAQGQGSTTSGASSGVQSTGSLANNPLFSSTAASAGAGQTTSNTTKGSNGILSVPSFLRGKNKTQPKLNISTKSTTDDLRCIIPGCKQSVYVDEEGVTSDFCSLRHREYVSCPVSHPQPKTYYYSSLREAVTSGLLSPCIMCLVLPQSDTDYFCSLACREEAMHKHYDEGETEPSPVESAN